MKRRSTISLLAIVIALLTAGSMAPAGQRKEGPVERDFLNPPMAVRPGAFWAWLNGSVSLDRLTYELEEMKDKGMRGADIWDVRALRDPDKMIPAGPPFLGEESLQACLLQGCGRLRLAEYGRPEDHSGRLHDRSDGEAR
ncbi:MAG: hypothetical protein Q7V01_10635 [Vicinamibacterales bacterium]|nr:hypothetical protein [Vicinamibacterales bacterium]